MDGLPPGYGPADYAALLSAAQGQGQNQGQGSGGADALAQAQLRARHDALLAHHHAQAPGGGDVHAGLYGHQHHRAAAAQGEEELLRLHDAHNRIMEAELAARAMRDRVVAEQHHASQARSMHAGLFAHQALGGSLGGSLHGHGGGQPRPDEAFRADSIERIVALQEEAAARHRDAARLRQASDNPYAGLAGYPGLSTAAGAPAGSPAQAVQMAEELALRERLQRQRLLEEELALRQRQLQLGNLQQQSQGGGGRGAAEREHLGRLLQLQQLSDEDLIRRAAEVRTGGQPPAPAGLGENGSQLEQRQQQLAALDRQLFEARLLQHQQGLQAQGLQAQNSQGSGGMAHFPPPQQGDLDRIDQAHADAAVARRMSNEAEGVPGLQHRQSTGSEAQGQQPLRYFNNGVEVDIHGNPLPNANANNAGASPSMNHGGGGAAEDNNIIAKFLTVVVSRVPEIAPAVADLLPDQGDPAVLKREFPHVVDATLAELRSVEERFGGSAVEGRSGDLHARVTNCIAAIEPYKMDLGAAAGGLLAGMGGGANGARPPLPAPSLDPGSCQALVPNGAGGLQPGMPGGMAGHPAYLAAMAQAGMAPPQYAALAAMPHPGAAAAAHAADRRSSSPDSDGDDDVPMMAAHKAHKKKKEHKASASNSNANTKGKSSGGKSHSKKGKKGAKKRKKNTEPRVVWRGALDGMEHGIANGIIRIRETGAAGYGEDVVTNSTRLDVPPVDADDDEGEDQKDGKSSGKGAGAEKKKAKKKKKKKKEEAGEDMAREDEAAAAAERKKERSRPMKKRRISDEAGAAAAAASSAGGNDDDVALPEGTLLPPIGAQKKKGAKSPVKDNSGKDGTDRTGGGSGKGGPHGELLHQLFGKKQSSKPATDTDDKDAAPSKGAGDDDKDAAKDMAADEPVPSKEATTKEEGGTDADPKGTVAEDKAAAAEGAEGTARSSPASSLITDDSDHGKRPGEEAGEAPPAAKDEEGDGSPSDDQDGGKEAEGTDRPQRRQSDHDAASVLLGLMGK